MGEPPNVLREVSDDLHPVLRVLLERTRAGSRPGRRTDDHVVCLAVEGGGLRGAVSAGMCAALEAAGLVDAFDRIYGVSAGALNGCCLAGGRAARGTGTYTDAADRRCINTWRLLARRPVIDFDFLFDELIATRRPLTLPADSGGPEFRALATSRETLGLRVLTDFTDARELTQAVRASATIPGLGSGPTYFRGEALIDGGVLEAIPFRTALREGATHVLVLRTRPRGFRVPRHWGPLQRKLLRREPDLAAVVGRQPAAYNRAADELERAGRDGATFQVAVPDGTPLIGRLETDRHRVDEALAAGAAAMFALVARDQPQARRRPAHLGLAAPVPANAPI